MTTDGGIFYGDAILCFIKADLYGLAQLQRKNVYLVRSLAVHLLHGRRILSELGQMFFTEMSLKVNF